ncbi:MAG: cold shock domain-containing protein [Chloroflexi bacterium]|nr:cold shock domain-containing protein [Chloroflexota bacterium]
MRVVMLAGEIRTISTDKGYGFIQPAAGGPDLFFHCSSVDADFDSLTLGQPVQYLPDESAQQPRAKSVITGTKTPRKDPPRNVARASHKITRRPPAVETHDYGFVTRLRRRKSEGSISSIQGGPEYLFNAESVIGEKDYYHLDVGDYVRFAPQENDKDPRQPLARSVMVVKRFVASSQENKPQQHPRSRGRKPTWR